MFKKKLECSKCGRKVLQKYRFCPFCGKQLEKDEKKPDSLFDEMEQIEKEIQKSMKMPFFLKLPMKGVIKQLTKDLTRELYELEKAQKNEKIEGKPHIMTKGFFINITNIDGKPVIRVSQLGRPPIKQKISEPKIQSKIDELTKTKNFSKNDLEKFSKLKKLEPRTQVRRLADKVIYELEMPGISEDKTIINHLGNSIEIKALAKEKNQERAYFKAIPVSLGILSWTIDEDRLILELEPE
ncbi:MAG: hypothetical protein QXP53_00325 [Candidatus Pacearchaeota archaeon]